MSEMKNLSIDKMNEENNPIEGINIVEIQANKAAMATMLFDTVRKVQNILAENMPESKADSETIINEILGVVDDQTFCLKMRNAETVTLKWPESSNVFQTSYAPSIKSLTVEFNSGGIYNYSNVPADVWNALVNAESVGRFVGKEIKGKYSYSKVN